MLEKALRRGRLSYDISCKSLQPAIHLSITVFFFFILQQHEQREKLLPHDNRTESTSKQTRL